MDQKLEGMANIRLRMRMSLKVTSMGSQALRDLGASPPSNLTDEAAGVKEAAALSLV